VVVLGLGTTLGVVVQTVALVPALRRAGIPLRPRFDLRGAGLRKAGRLAKWVFLYVVANQLAYLVVVRLAADAFEQTPGRSYASYVYAFLLWQLPHAVVAVSVITGLLPRMSRAAADGRTDDLRASLNRGLRLTVALMVPAVAVFLVLGRDIAIVVFGRFNTSLDEARFIGVLLAGLRPRPAAVQHLPAAAARLLRPAGHPDALLHQRVGQRRAHHGGRRALPLAARRVQGRGLAAGHATSFVVGLVVCSRVLSRRIGGLDGGVVVQTAVRCLLAALLPALLAWAAAAGVHALLGDGTLPSLVALAVGGALLGLGYLLAARRLRVAEVEEAVGPVLRRLRRR
jgi:putative peptidoglycan lipid II flippase